MRNRDLVPERRTDRRGVAVTRWVRPDKGAAAGARSIPAPSAATTREPFVPGPNETAQTMHIFEVGEGNHPIKVAPPSPELLAIPRPPSPEMGRLPREGYWFEASYAEFYDVLSAVPPQDALDLLQRGIRSADEARAFLDEHGLAHLGWEARGLTEEMMRRSLPPKWVLAQMGSVVGYEPTGAVDAILACRKHPSLAAVADSIATGEVTLADLEETRATTVAAVSLPAVVRAIIASKAERRDDFTLAEVREIISSYSVADEEVFAYTPASLQAALLVLRYHSADEADELLDNDAFVRARSALGPELSEQDERRLAGIAVFASEVDGMVDSHEDADALIDAYDRGIDIEALNEYLAGTNEHDPLWIRVRPFTEGVAAPVSDGWL